MRAVQMFVRSTNQRASTCHLINALPFAVSRLPRIYNYKSKDIVECYAQSRAVSI